MWGKSRHFSCHERKSPPFYLWHWQLCINNVHGAPTSRDIMRMNKTVFAECFVFIQHLFPKYPQKCCSHCRLKLAVPILSISERSIQMQSHILEPQHHQDEYKAYLYKKKWINKIWGFQCREIQESKWNHPHNHQCLWSETFRFYTWQSCEERHHFKMS